MLQRNRIRTEKRRVDTIAEMLLMTSVKGVPVYA